MEKPIRAALKYEAVQYSGGEITGKTNMGFEGPCDTSFAWGLSLFAVNLAMELLPNSITQFMSVADGYGIAGYFPGGYDWSGIRDSSPKAVAAMLVMARMVLSHFKGRMPEMGLPANLIKDLTE
jgi:hypothetical protein